VTFIASAQGKQVVDTAGEPKEFWLIAKRAEA